jgi:hypothetical protein
LYGALLEVVLFRIPRMGFLSTLKRDCENYLFTDYGLEVGTEDQSERITSAGRTQY